MDIKIDFSSSNATELIQDRTHVVVVSKDSEGKTTIHAFGETEINKKAANTIAESLRKIIPTEPICKGCKFNSNEVCNVDNRACSSVSKCAHF